MAHTRVGTTYMSGTCYGDYRVTDANDLLLMGLADEMIDFDPTYIYSVPAGCGEQCNDDNGKLWTNCKGYDNIINTQITKKNQGFIIAFIIVAVGFAAYWYFTKK